MFLPEDHVLGVQKKKIISTSAPTTYSLSMFCCCCFLANSPNSTMFLVSRRRKLSVQAHPQCTHCQCFVAAAFLPTARIAPCSWCPREEKKYQYKRTPQCTHCPCFCPCANTPNITMKNKKSIRGPCFWCPSEEERSISTSAPYNVLTVSVSALAAGALVVEDHVLGVQEELALQKLGGGLDLVQVAPLRQLRQQPLDCKCHKGQGQAINVKANIRKGQDQ